MHHNQPPQKQPRVYVGNGKSSRTGNPVNFSVNIDQLLDLIASGRAQVWKKKTGERNVKLTLWANPEPDQYGNTHAICLDDYVPQPRQDQPATTGGSYTNDLPF